MKTPPNSSQNTRCRAKKIEGIIFDVDGTLTDSIDAYFEVFREASARFGIDVKREDILEPMAVGSLIWERAIPQGLPDRDEKIRQITEIIPDIFREVFRRVRPFPGLASVLSELHERGIKLGVLTSSSAVAVRPLHEHGLSQYLDVIISREDGLPRKPAPDGILECLNRLQVPSDKALTVGDSPLDIQAGKAAGTYTVGVLSGVASRRQLEAEAPTAIIGGVSELMSFFLKMGC